MEKIVPEFTGADIRAMHRRNILVLPLFGLSINGLVNDGKDLFVSSSLDDKALNQKALIGQIAIDPNRILLPDSNYKIHSEHLNLINTFSGELPDNWGIAHAMAIMPNAPTAVGAFFASLREDRQLEELKFNYGSTSTKLGQLNSVIVGDSSFFGRVRVGAWGRDGRDNLVWALPVVVPTR